ncbi:MAG: 3-oxoacyl-[acyl-carrier protein] reductase [Verrucomicrobiales bacterium]|jgi:3-oxoacyl-[acyl-carrier protein] reductase
MAGVAFITGGSRGIGLGIAHKLAAEGYDLAINGVRDVASVGEVIESLRATGVRVAYCQGDVSDLSSHERMIHHAVKELGQINILVNNAGVAPLVRVDVLEMSEESWERVMGINLKGNVFLAQRVANYFLEQRKSTPGFTACLVNINSVSATMVSANRAEYCISKAGLAMATQLFAVRLGPDNIPVYEVRPGVIRSDMTAGVVEKYDRLIADGLCPQLRWGEPEDVAKAVFALVKGDFPYSSGQVFMVDGGMTIQRL